MDTTAPLADERCSRCGQAFHCGLDDAVPCACTQVRLGPELLDRLRREFTGCLCMDCLRALAAAAEPGR